MKKITTYLAVLFIFGGVGTCYGDQARTHSWTVGSQISYIEYNEPDIMKEKGIMYGVAGAYTYNKGLVLKAEGVFSYGNVDYTSSNSGSMNNINDYLFEIRALGGYELKISNTFNITPFFGFGYRYLRDDTSGMSTTTGARGYLRESNYYYSPIGMKFLFIMDKGWSIDTILEYDYFWQGKQKSYLSTAFSSYNDLENTQNRGYGLRASVAFKKKSQNVEYIFEPFIKYWNIDRSDLSTVTYSGVIVGYGYEPRNTSTEIGLLFAVGF